MRGWMDWLKVWFLAFYAAVTSFSHVGWKKEIIWSRSFLVPATTNCGFSCDCLVRLWSFSKWSFLPCIWKRTRFLAVRLEAKALFAPCQSNLSCMSANEKTHIMLANSEEPGNLGCPFSLSLHFRKFCIVSMLPCPYRSWQPGAAKRLCLFVFPSSHLSVCWAAKEMQLRRILVMFDSVCPCAFFMYGSIFVCVYLYHAVIQFDFVT